MIKHYEGELGNFDYDDEEFEIVNEHGSIPYMHYIGKSLSINLPKGCVNTRKMFENCILPEGSSLGHFDTSNVVDMNLMFHKSTLPTGFSLGDKFDTSKVTNMSDMFSYCIIPKGFSLGDKFDTSNVIAMSYMFTKCVLPEDFSLGNKFNTNKVKTMTAMFFKCAFPKNFLLGKNFSIDNIQDMNGMFLDCKLPSGAPDTEDPQDIINWLKFRDVNNTENTSNEHVVWGILDKSKYTYDGVAKIEQLYARLCYVKDTLGDTVTKELCDMLNWHNSETYAILRNFAQDEDTESMNLF